jgi:hypothetical protein
MNGGSKRELPTAVWSAYFGIVAVGLVVGFLSGAGVISWGALVVFMVGSVAGFVSWAVWKLDPDVVTKGRAYRQGREDEA